MVVLHNAMESNMVVMQASSIYGNGTQYHDIQLVVVQSTVASIWCIEQRRPYVEMLHSQINLGAA